MSSPDNITITYDRNDGPEHLSITVVKTNPVLLLCGIQNTDRICEIMIPLIKLERMLSVIKDDLKDPEDLGKV